MNIYPDKLLGVHRLTKLPSDLEPNRLYLIKPDGVSTVDAVFTDNDGNPWLKMKGELVK